MPKFEDVVLVCDLCGETIDHSRPKRYCHEEDLFIEPHPCVDCYMQKPEKPLVLIPKADTYGEEDKWWVHRDFRRKAYALVMELGFGDLYEEDFDDAIQVLAKMGCIKFEGEER
jgi:hypothetical protein